MIRLNVKAVRDFHLQGNTCRRPGMNGFSFNERRGLDPSPSRGLGQDKRRTQEEPEDRRTPGTSAGGRSNHHFTSFKGMTSALGSGPNSSPNLTGGPSWNMKSHFKRSAGFDASSQLRAD